MNTLAIILAWVFTGLIAIHGVLGLGFVRILRQPPRSRLTDENCPKAAVILCVRGSDPFLADCVRGLLIQDYPYYTVHIVVDHPNDPARAVVDEVIARLGASHVRVHVLSKPRETCSLKSSCQIQVVEGLDESVEVIAMVDADTVPHRQWLRDLVAPLTDERVGAVTGNRWYMPTQLSGGAILRYAWNAAAVVQMYWNQIAWGGTLALKTSFVRESGLLHRWGYAFGEDSMLQTVLKQQDLKMVFVPSLIMINREVCTIAGFFRWVCRQLFSVRVHHPSWKPTLILGFYIALTLLSAVPIGVTALIGQQWYAALLIGASLLGFELTLLVLLLLLELSIRRIVHHRGEPVAWLTPKSALACIAAVPLVQLLYSVALLKTLSLRTVEWRGVHYRLISRDHIQLLEYQPYCNSRVSSNASMTSL